MFKVTKKPNTPNIVWDDTAQAPLCRFSNGAFETNDKAVADKLVSMGYTVVGGADVKPLDELKVDELKAYAAEHGIELGEAVKKADILKIIQEAGNHG